MKKSPYLYCFFLLGFLLYSCQSDQQEQKKNELGTSNTNKQTSSTKTLFQLLDTGQTGIDFVNKIEDIPSANVNIYDNFYNGGGVAIGDINNDDLLDVLFLGNQVANKLYLNKGNLQFEDVTAKAGIADVNYWSNSASMIDINEDGWLDIYICHAGPASFYKKKNNTLYINQGDGTFKEQAQAHNLVDDSYSTNSAFFDYDVDGDLDLFVMNHTDFINRFANANRQINTLDQINNYLQEGKNRENACNILFENKGNGQFVRSTQKAGVMQWGFGLGLSVCDFDKDNLPDLYVANDHEVPDFMYHNSKGKFVDVNKERLGHNAQFSMGCDFADFNNDTWPDFAIVDMVSADRVRNKTLMAPMNESKFIHLTQKRGYQKQFMFNVMQLNNGGGYFSDIGLMTGTSLTDWSWSSLFADFDLDGDKDYYVTNGYLRDTRNRDIGNQLKKEAQALQAQGKKVSREQRLENLKKFPSVPLVNHLYVNQGNYHFENLASELGMSQESFSNGAAYADLDNDGDLDLIVNNINAPAFVYKNLQQEKSNNNYLVVKMGPENKNLNAKLTLYTGNEKQYIDYHPTRGFFSSMYAPQVFGLGNYQNVDSLIVEWIYGDKKVLKNIDANQTIKVSITDQDVVKPNAPKKQNTHFDKLTASQKGLNFKHQENEYWDFKRETLLPHKQSTHGPSLAVGDVNGDGLEDVYVGGAKDQAGVLYLQNKQQGFSQSQQSSFQNTKAFEDIGALFFDCDNDQDLDLYVSSGGGGAFLPYQAPLQDRLYKNDGKGNFTLSEKSLPLTHGSNGRVKACDFDKDGDLDLFVAGRVVPGFYPVVPKSYLLQNDNGNFSNVTPDLAKDLEKIGMVTDFIWMDLNQDEYQDLVLVGEWMNIEFFVQKDGVFVKSTEQYLNQEMRAWWFSLEAADFDNDGDQDLVAGNLGLNNKFHPSKKKPFEIYFDDFDENGTFDIVLTKCDKGKTYPLRGKDCSTEQMPFISEKYKTYEAFANATINDVFKAEKLDKATNYKITDFQSVYLENKNGQFVPQALPTEVQFAPIMDMLCKDINKDGNMDIVLAGNLTGTEIETPSYDAGTGYLLLGKGDGHFEAIHYTQSGIHLNGDVRNMAWLNIQGTPHLLVANNNSHLQLLKANFL